jgi:transcriptional regulator with XRE-family HTH domain
MQQTERLMNTLKQQLRQRGLTYEDVARHLKLSTSSVKRLFSAGGLTMERLESVCELADIDFLELAREAETDRMRLRNLTEEQEREIVSNPKLLLVSICVHNRWSFNEILEHYDLTKHELIRALAKLDGLGILDLLPGNRIRLRVSRTFTWLPNGPIHRFFVRNVQHEFLAGRFDKPGEAHRFSWGLLSKSSNERINSKLNELLDLFDECTRSDEVTPGRTSSGTCLLVALREWEPRGFRDLRRTP